MTRTDVSVLGTPADNREVDALVAAVSQRATQYGLETPRAILVVCDADGRPVEVEAAATTWRRRAPADVYAAPWQHAFEAGDELDVEADDDEDDEAVDARKDN